MNNIIEKIKNDKIISLIKQHSAGVELYLVGGVVRDLFLEKENFDKDLVVADVDAKVFAQNLAKSLDATFIELDSENRIYRLVLSDKVNFIDIAQIMGETLEEDLRRRDLTINAIAYSLNTDEIIDITGGIEDLKNKKIRHISEQNFLDDPLRLLRVYRFQAMLCFDVDNELTSIVKKHAEKITKPAIERVNYEFLKLLSGDFSAQALIDLDNVGLLKEIFPVCEEIKKIPPNSHHHLNLFGHSIEVVNQIQQIYEKSSDKVRAHLEKVDFGGATRLAHLKLAGLLHDIGKPSTWTIEEDTGRHRFIKHDDIGSKMGSSLLKKMKYSKKQIEYIAKMIKNHIYPSHVVSSPELNDKIYMRFIRKMEDDVVDVIVLAMADRLSARGPEISDKIVNENISKLSALLEFYLSIKDNLKPLPKLLSGNEIMEILDIEPSKELGNVVNALKEAQISGEVVTKEDAILFVKNK